MPIKNSKKNNRTFISKKKQKTVAFEASTILDNEFSLTINSGTQRLHVYLDEFEFNFSFLSIKEKLNVCQKYSFNALFDMFFEKKFYVMKHSNKFILYAKTKLINDFFI